MPVPVFRFAPSPNGYLHRGHAYSALLNARLAARESGRFLLRIEDIDPLRSRPEFIEAIEEDLAWLDLSWDRPVLRQSARMAAYADVLRTLRRRGLAYPCFCSRADTARFVAAAEAGGAAWPRDPDGTPVHAGPCRALARADVDARLAAGAPHTIRLAMDRALEAARPLPPLRDWDPPSGRVADVVTAPAAWGDPVIGRRDVPASYHLAVVVDDAAQGVTHVVRGMDLRPATDLHVLLQALLGLAGPFYHHHPLLVDEAGRKLAKSRASTALRALRAEGATAAEVIAALRMPDWAGAAPAPCP